VRQKGSPQPPSDEPNTTQGLSSADFFPYRDGELYAEGCRSGASPIPSGRLFTSIPRVVERRYRAFAEAFAPALR